MVYLLTYTSIIHFHLTQEKTARVKFFQQHIRKKYHICSEIFFKKLFRGKQKLSKESAHTHTARSRILFVPFVWCSCCRRSSFKVSILSNSWAFFKKSSTWSILTANCIRKTKSGRKYNITVFYRTQSSFPYYRAKSLEFVSSWKKAFLMTDTVFQCIFFWGLHWLRGPKIQL